MDNIKLQINARFVAAWFAASTTALIFSILFSVYLSQVKLLNPSAQNFKLYAALPKSEVSIAAKIDYADGRTKLIEDFFRDYKSPLANYSFSFVKTADKYNLDFRLLPAIAMQESLGGIKVIKDSYNPFGYGIYQGLVIRFSSWEESIERVGKALREDYLNTGLKTPGQIMAKYTPPSLARDGAWAKGVSSFMQELR